MTTRLTILDTSVTLKGRAFSCPDDTDLEAALNQWAALAPYNPAKGTPEGQLRADAVADWGADVVSYTDTEGVLNDVEY